MRAEFIPDDEAEIQDTLIRLKQRVGPDGVVFTSGQLQCMVVSMLPCFAVLKLSSLILY